MKFGYYLMGLATGIVAGALGVFLTTDERLSVAHIEEASSACQRAAELCDEIKVKP